MSHLPMLAYGILFSFGMLFTAVAAIVMPVTWSLLGPWTLVMAPVAGASLWATLWLADRVTERVNLYLTTGSR